MVVKTKSKDFTFDDFCFLVKEDQKADLIDGVIYMASPDNTDANSLFVWLIGIIDHYVDTKGLGKIYGSRVAFRLDNKNSPEPDIAFVRNSRLKHVQRGRVDGPADLAMEIVVSPESIHRDYELKRALYQKAGVEEYWIIDDIEEKITELRLSATGKYQEVRPRKGEWHSQVLTGFWLRAEWLWSNPRPKKDAVIQLLLRAQK